MKRYSVKDIRSPKYPNPKLGENHNPIIMEESGDLNYMPKFRQIESSAQKKKLSIEDAPQMK